MVKYYSFFHNDAFDFYFCRAWRLPLGMVKYYSFFRKALRLTIQCLWFVRSSDFCFLTFSLFFLGCFLAYFRSSPTKKIGSFISVSVDTSVSEIQVSRKYILREMQIFDFCRVWRQPFGMITYYILFRNALRLTHSRPFIFWEVVIFFPRVFPYFLSARSLNRYRFFFFFFRSIIQSPR